ncbi:MAG: hypothetical protein Unbinned6805contig1000_48 [Prokaryotic dsDNA virus sp.]|nr:MAG: hypothetical protein Unbinned6805contig1000_48 [Prokaryotic dsDNA virus sp.]|tara:strand:+ start:3275 stop:5674 length:2400 start_codon:yes stop_codon:yes gene_type:complete
MARQAAKLEVNNFSKGLITEAGPLTFPQNASLFEKNFELNIDRSRSRRLGMDLEDGYVTQTADVTLPSTGDLATQTYVWENVSRDPDKEFVVVQVGNLIRIFDNRADSISAAPVPHYDGVSVVDSIDVGTSSVTERFGIASVDGSLVIASGVKEITIINYDGSQTFKEGKSLRVRDVFGVEDLHTIDGEEQNLYDPTYIAYRPAEAEVTDNHLYNLSNQSWGVPRESSLEEETSSTIRDFIAASIEESPEFQVPSNADTIHYGIGFNTNNPPREVFFPARVIYSPSFRVDAPRGYFIIDALERGKSREEEYLKNVELFGESFPPFISDHPSLASGSLPSDTTSGGATVLGEHSGRIFYAGFSGNVIDGDSRSPDLSSYVLFSQIVEQPEQIVQCYQEGDPTSSDTKDLVASDGGFIKIQGAYGIKALESVGNGLVVLAENGVWMIRGDSGVGFSATAYEVIKLSSQGCSSAGSAVAVNSTLYYWGDSGIFRVAPNEVGAYSTTNITSNNIQSFYVPISDNSKRRCNGSYDSYSERIRWVFNNSLVSDELVNELVLDLVLGAFYISEVAEVSPTQSPVVASPFQAPPYSSGDSIEPVQVNGDQVQMLGADVHVTETVRVGKIKEIKYLTITSASPNINGVDFTFSLYRDSKFRDWASVDGIGVDAEATLITGYLTGGDSSSYKQVPLLMSHFKRTEDSFEEIGGDLVPSNQSSCIIQAQWEWCNSPNSNRWGREFQAYQYSRHWIPEDGSSAYDTGYSTVITRRKLRGKGRALSLLFKSEPEKDLVLIGWNMVVQANGRA